MNSSKYAKSPGRQSEGTLGVRFNHAAFKKHRMVFYLQPWFDEVRIVLAGNLAGLAAGAYYYFVQRPLPKKKGDLIIEGLHEPVEIIFDRFGVPHIYAENEDDLFFAQGYVHAQDRL